MATRSLAALFLLSACQSGELVWTPARPGAWVSADLHAHSSVGSDDIGDETGSWPADYAALAPDRGLQLVVLTDHSNSAGSMDCETGDVEDCPNQGPEFPVAELAVEATAASEGAVAVVAGLEISPRDPGVTPVGHTGCLPSARGALTDWTGAVVDRPMGTVDGASGITWCQRAGGLAVLNHPYGPVGWVASDWTSLDYDAMEVFNGSAWFDDSDGAAWLAWVCDLDAGRRPALVGGSDVHRVWTDSPAEDILDQALGLPVTWVWSEAGEQDVVDVPAALDGLAHGRTVVGDPETSLELWVRAGGLAVGPGDTLRALGPHTVEARIVAESRREPEWQGVSGLSVQLLDIAGACVADPRVADAQAAIPEVAPEVLWSEPLGSGESIDVVVEVTPGRRLVARVWPDMPELDDTDYTFSAPLRSLGVALTGPVEVE